MHVKGLGAPSRTQATPIQSQPDGEGVEHPRAG
jgi:hypothetical protein